jgi:murein L,D-transpeptidase YcbB/YkuD
MRRIAASFEPGSREYLILKQALAKAISAGDSIAERQLARSVNSYRWMLHFHFNRFIVVNVASATLKYYNVDFPLLQMKTVCGKPSTRTPRFSAYLDQVIFYPYWHVPRSIAVNELLPVCRKNPAILDAMNIEVLNDRGYVVDAGTVPWEKLSKNNFPYQFRQGTGCDNALGVIKFNLTSPYRVYLHDTNLKSAFQSAQRYYSHGCIRIEKPQALAQLLVPGKVDSNFLRACVRGQRPVTETLREPVPIFVLYMTADVEDSHVRYYPDTYKLEE